MGTIWHEDFQRRRKPQLRDLLARGMDAGIPGGRVCQTTTQLANMPRGASQMPSLLKYQTRLQNHWRSDFSFLANNRNGKLDCQTVGDALMVSTTGGSILTIVCVARPMQNRKDNRKNQIFIILHPLLHPQSKVYPFGFTLTPPN